MTRHCIEGHQYDTTKVKKPLKIKTFWTKVTEMRPGSTYLKFNEVVLTSSDPKLSDYTK